MTHDSSALRNELGAERLNWFIGHEGQNMSDFVKGLAARGADTETAGSEGSPPSRVVGWLRNKIDPLPTRSPS
jgi:hypothetical protein